MSMRRNRNAKIIATLGPASSSRDVIRRLFEEGADVFRLNFSHGTQENHARRYRIIRELERETGRPIGVPFRLDLDAAAGDERRVSVPHPEVFEALAPGLQLLFDDGKVRLTVETCSPRYAQTRVVVGGPMSDRKGLSVVGAVVLPLSALRPIVRT